MKATRILLYLCVAPLFACGSQGSGGGATVPKGTVDHVVFHTSTAMLSGKLSSSGPDGGALADRLRERVRNFYPAACLDADSDADGVPDSIDHGQDDDAADDASDAGGDDALRCKRCNRGPGNNGDFRYEERGTEASLDRGRIVSRSASTLVVAGPSGAITIELTSGTRLDSDHGAPTPGAEIRAEGTLQPGASRTFQASRVTVLCPGPGVVPDAEVPTEIELTPVPPSDSPN